MTTRMNLPGAETPGGLAASVVDAGLRLQITPINPETITTICRGWRRHSFFELCWLEGGGGDYRHDGRSHPITAGTLVFVSVGQTHRWLLEDTTRGWLLGFAPADLGNRPASESAMEELPFFCSPDFPATLLIPNVERESLGRDFEMLQGELNSSDPLRFEAARALLQLILIRAQRQFSSREHTRIEERNGAKLARQFWWELEKGFLASRRVQDYATRLRVTVAHLNEAVRAHFDQTPGELIDERVYLEARRLLFHTGNSVSEIAYSLNFRTPSHFGAFFKRHALCSPGDARRLFEQQLARPGV